MPYCTGLNIEWTSTIKTATQFPVNTGTVVEVECSYSDAVNEGSNEVTCSTGTLFTFSKEPNCFIAGNFKSYFDKVGLPSTILARVTFNYPSTYTNE